MNRIVSPRFLLSATLLFSLSIAVTPGARAQAQTGSSPAPVNPRAYDASKETVISGTITEIVSKPKPGLPLGMHVMVSTAQGQMDVQLGPYFGRIARQKGVVAGATIQATGVVSHFDAGDVFVARTVTVGNETIPIRNRNGFPSRRETGGTRVVRGTQPQGGL
ncbi:MAG TPA: hypothetical protein VLW54_08240 [Candidatus Acidoferrales bacterium]|nr:hypothetical protein [Candidatus Acidoferrales bacterium]